MELRPLFTDLSCSRLRGNIPKMVLNYERGSVHCSSFNSLSNEIGIVSKTIKTLTQQFLPGETHCNYYRALLRFIDLEIGSTAGWERDDRDEVHFSDKHNKTCSQVRDYTNMKTEHQIIVIYSAFIAVHAPDHKYLTDTSIASWDTGGTMMFVLSRRGKLRWHPKND